MQNNNKKDLDTLLQLFWEKATALVIKAFSPLKLQFKSILGSERRDCGLFFYASETVKQPKGQGSPCIHGTSEPISVKEG